jgi:hypothetical protein
MLIQIQNGQPTGPAVLESNFKQLFPGTSFSQFLTPSDVEPFGFGMYDFASQPKPGKYEKVVEVEPVKDDQGIYRQTWAVAQMDDSEKAAEDERKAVSIRAERNAKLAASDWTQIADSTADKAAWAAYRQALRDITAQAGFPWTIDWPEQP